MTCDRETFAVTVTILWITAYAIKNSKKSQFSLTLKRQTPTLNAIRHNRVTSTDSNNTSGIRQYVGAGETEVCQMLPEKRTAFSFQNPAVLVKLI